MSPTDIDYAKFVDILDNSQGDLLRALSKVVAPALQALTCGGMYEQRLSHTGTLTVDKVVMYPKGSSAFLGLIKDLYQIDVA